MASPLFRSVLDKLPLDEYATEPTPETITADLSLTINPLGPSPRIQEALGTIDARSFAHYPHAPIELIEAIAARFSVEPEAIVLTAGCDGAISLVTRAIVENGTRVVLPRPSWHRYALHIKAMGGTVSYGNDAKLYIASNPITPTGELIAESSILELVETFNAVLIDEALGDGIESSASLTKEHENLLVARSFSKSYALASLRIGYLIAHPRTAAMIRRLASPFEVSSIAAQLALEALRDTEHLHRMIAFVESERTRVFRALDRLGIEHSDSSIGVFFVNAHPMSEQELIGALANRGVKVTGAAIFNCDAPGIRVALATAAENDRFIEAMERITDPR